MLKYLTTDFELEDAETFFIEPTDLLEHVFTRIFHAISRYYPDCEKHRQAANP